MKHNRTDSIDSCLLNHWPNIANFYINKYNKIYVDFDERGHKCSIPLESRLLGTFV